MRLVSVWLHVLGIVAWIGGLAYQAHVLGPAARRGGAGVFAEAARRGRPIAWTAVAVVALTGFYNVTRLGPLERVIESGAGLLLANVDFDKVMSALVCVAVVWTNLAYLLTTAPLLVARLRGPAAADAYLARGNVYWSAGQPRLYKYALADFRQVLKYDPDNDEARQKIDTIEGIYRSMGRPIPEVSQEP